MEKSHDSFECGYCHESISTKFYILPGGHLIARCYTCRLRLAGEDRVPEIHEISFEDAIIYSVMES
jgi:hypothetical protein